MYGLAKIPTWVSGRYARPKTTVTGATFPRGVAHIRYVEYVLSVSIAGDCKSRTMCNLSSFYKRVRVSRLRASRFRV